MKPLQTAILKFLQPCAKFFSETSWKGVKSLFNHGVYYRLTPDDHKLLQEKLASGYYLILVGGHPTLSTFLIKLGTLFTDGKWPKYTHILMNVDGEDSADKWQNFRLIEATGVKGVSYATFDEVFDVDCVMLLRPKNFSVDEWNAAIEEQKNSIGKQYDSLFDLLDDSEVSCVELIRDSLIKADDKYMTDYASFESLIQKKGNLVPQMYADDLVDFKCELKIER